MPNCTYCGESCENYTYIGSAKVWHCNNNTCVRALEDEMYDEYLWEKELDDREDWESEDPYKNWW